MISLQTTLTLNNRAVELFHSKNIPEATKTYYQSLCIVKELIRLRSPISEDASTTSKDTLPLQESCHSSTQPSKTISMEENKLFFVYQSTLILQESTSSSSMEIYCAAILFNAAILHHQESIKTGNSVFMSRAHKLYASSLQLLNALPNHHSGNDTVTLLKIANNNNLARIEMERGLVMEAGERLRFLSHLLHTSQPAVGRIFKKDEFHGIFSNTVLGARNGMISSPAA